MFSNEKQRKKQLYDILAYIFILKPDTMQSIFVAFCSFYKPECVLRALPIPETKKKYKKKMSFKSN